MAKIGYALEPGGPKRVELAWRGTFQDLTVSLDGSVLGAFRSRRDLERGGGFELADGSTLWVQLGRDDLGAPEWIVLRDDEPLPGAPVDPAERVKLAAGMVYFTGALSIALGSLAVLRKSRLLLSLGLGMGSIAVGFVYLALGFLVGRRSSVALMVAIGLCLVDGLVGFTLVSQQGGNPPIAMVVGRFFLVLPMIQGFGAIAAMKREQAAGALSSRS